MSRKSTGKVRRRNRRIKKRKQNNEFNRWTRSRIRKDVNEAVNYYARGNNVLPYPTLLEAVSQENPENNDAIKSVFEACFKTLDKRIEDAKNSGSLVGAHFKSIISFLIPLDFFMSVPEPYYVGVFEETDDGSTMLYDVAIFSDDIKVGYASKVKLSFMLVSICQRFVGVNCKIADFAKNDKVNYLYDRAIAESNKIISAYQAIPTRHNHYMHSIAKWSLPGSIYTTLLNFGDKKKLDAGYVNFHFNFESEVFQARPLAKREMTYFRVSHINETFTDDRVFMLISKFNEAMNARCMGKYDVSVILADNFVELAVGYIFCEITSCENGGIEEAVQMYSNMKSMNDVWRGLCSAIGVSMNELKNEIQFGSWYKYCREVRNELCHRFIYAEVSNRDSANALYYSSTLIRSVVGFCESKCNMSSASRSKLTLLADSTQVANAVLEHYHD